MFEPLKNLLGEHSERLSNELGLFRGVVQDNTEALRERNQSARKSVLAQKESVGEIRNDSGYGWRIKWVAVTAEMHFMVGILNDEAFQLQLKKYESKEVDWYLPPGGVLFAKNVGAEEGHANIEIDVLETSAVEGFTGRSDEHLDLRRREPIPSGTPLDDPVAP